MKNVAKSHTDVARARSRVSCTLLFHLAARERSTAGDLVVKRR